VLAPAPPLDYIPVGRKAAIGDLRVFSVAIWTFHLFTSILSFAIPDVVWSKWCAQDIVLLILEEICGAVKRFMHNI
jgi:hypothetical protein